VSADDPVRASRQMANHRSRVVLHLGDYHEIHKRTNEGLRWATPHPELHQIPVLHVTGCSGLLFQPAAGVWAGWPLARVPESEKLKASFHRPYEVRLANCTKDLKPKGASA